MADAEKAMVKEPTTSLGDKILHNAIVADAAVVIIQQKLLKLLQCKLITICSCLEQQIQDIYNSLDPVYEFLIDRPKGNDEIEWNSKLLEAIYQMEDWIDIFQSRIALEDSANFNRIIRMCHPNMFLTLRAKCLLWRCLQEFKSQIKSLKKTKHISSQSKRSNPAKDGSPQGHRTLKWGKLFSLDICGNLKKVREDQMNEVTKQMKPGNLKDDKITVIIGEQGIGKTFLARKFFTQFHYYFDPSAWVDVSKTGTARGVLHGILTQVLDMSSLMPDAQQLNKHLQESLHKELYGKSYLIVLDDVGSFDLLWHVLCSLPDSNSGGRILVTTQEMFIAEDSIMLEGLTREEIIALAEGKLEIVGGGLDNLKKVEDDFIKKCRGSPLRLNLLSGLIANSLDPVEKVLEMIPDTDDLDDLFTYCYTKMRRELKPCLLYMALFPKGYPISVRRLLRLWFSEGLLITPGKAKMEPEDLGQDFLMELVVRNFIEIVKWKEDGSPTRVRLVTCLHDLFCSRAIGTELLYINTLKGIEGEQHQQEQAASRIRWLAEHSDMKGLRLPSSPGSKISHLRSFLSFNSREGILNQDIGNFLGTVFGKGFILLSVLDLEGVYKPNLDKVLGKLVLLKHLGLRSTALGSLPKSVADLRYLETLDVKNTNITEIPKSFWKKSRNLRHLYLNGFYHIDNFVLSSSFMTNIEPMANLHTLSGAIVDGICVDRSTGVLKGLDNMKKLTKLGIMFQHHHENQNAIGEWVSDLKSLQSLKFGIIESSQPSTLPPGLSLSQHHSLLKLHLLGKFEASWKMLLPLNLIALTLCGSDMTDDHISQLGNLTNLKVLNLRAKSFTRETFKLPRGLAEKLEILRLWKLEKLQKIELKDKLPNIRVIEVRSCFEMVEINQIQNVPSERPVLLQLTDMHDTFHDKIKTQVDECLKNYEITIKKMKLVQVEEGKKANEQKKNETKEAENLDTPEHLSSETEQANSTSKLSKEKVQTL